MRETAAMPSEEERKQIALTYCRRVSEGEVEDLVGLFAPEATVEDPVGGDPVTGHAALREFYGKVVGRVEVEPGAGRAGQDGSSVALPITVRVEVDGQPREIAAVDLFEIDEAGKITRMRSYWGTSDVT